MTGPVIITSAPNGARRQKSDHPQIPLTIAEIGYDAARCVAAGAAMVHIHVRDREGRHVLDADAYRDATREIRRQAGAGVIIQITTEAVGRYTPQQQMDLVDDVGPEACSIALKEIMPDDASEMAAARFFEACARTDCLIQHILYSPDEVRRFQTLGRRGLIPTTRASVLFVLGRYTAGEQSNPVEVIDFMNAWELALPWGVCAFGRREAACVTAAALFGGHARVGFENNLHLPDGRLAPDNAALVRCVADAATQLGIPPASSDEARAIFAAQG
ncbi:3-keto-5-aminohexanoate cleavage protein [Microvirga antarctica]|uniref:3-keto-5-aminohexanoate cleavage protein n=1 Tax=Microvirga antarctica TaxID=2819233 RepID=UPI001B304FB9|nr:3-keto-5-aminohexanoate cleavage protein [Microvirga antarctica]